MSIQNPTLLILRGLPGNGKTTYAKLRAGQAGDACIVSADAYPGLYNDDLSMNFALLPAAHDACFEAALIACELVKEGGAPLVIVDNTNTTLAEMSPYRMVGRMCGMNIEIVHMTSNASDGQLADRNTHGVPRQAIAGMRERWENLPPFWEGEATFEVGGAA